MNSRIVQSFVGVLATAACLALAPAARAGYVFQSSYDPLDLVVNVQYNVDPSCFSGATAGWVGANLFDSSAHPCNVYVSSVVATLTDTDIGTPGNHPFVYIPFLTTDDSPISDPLISAIFYTGDNLPPQDGFGGLSWLQYSFGPKTTSTSTSSLNGTWRLSFGPLFNFLNGPPLNLNDNAPDPSVATLYQGEHCFTLQGTRRCLDYDPFLTATVTTGGVFGTTGVQYLGVYPVGQEPTPGRDGLVRVAALVPEPSSIALILGALGAGWLTRRRKVTA